MMALRTRRFTFNRWWGLAGGVLWAVVDTASIVALGIRFQVNGSDATLFTGLFFGSSFALLGFLLGYVVEGRRRDREAAAVICEQADAIATARTRVT